MSIHTRRPGTTTHNSSSGFTVIELLITVAIAGLILIVVFLAITNLRRVARNHQRKLDVTFMQQALIEFRTTHQGVAPTFFRWPGPGNGGICINYGTYYGCAEAEDFFFNDVQKYLSFYRLNTDLFYATDFAAFGGNGFQRANPATIDQVWMTSSSKCDNSASNQGGIVSINNVNSLVITYGLETNNGTVYKCVDIQ